MISNAPNIAALPSRALLESAPVSRSEVDNNSPLGAGPADQVGGAPLTNEAVTAPDPSSKPQSLPERESNEAARLVEPSRLAPESLTRQAQAPTEETPAGPTPAFDLTILEKTRAVAANPSEELAQPKRDPAVLAGLEP
ncbi:MAG: hypothetical protein AAGO57_03265, partial [Pseudomonadota bacterium]